MIRLITGGARSGKSSYAESLFKDREDVLYIATAKVEDQEMEERVKKHRERRPISWGLYEGYRNLGAQVSKDYSAYLLDCVTILSSNILFDRTKGMERIPDSLLMDIEEDIYQEIAELIEAVRSKDKDLILVTNELGQGMVPMDSLSRSYRDLQGRINQRLGRIVDEVYLVVCGIEMKIK